MATRSDWEKVECFVDGQRIILDGIDGIIQVRGTYPYIRISHQPSPSGRKTEAYRAVKHELRDDWSADLTNSERIVEVYAKLGIRFTKDGKIHVPEHGPARTPRVGSAQRLLHEMDKRHSGGGARARRPTRRA